MACPHVAGVLALGKAAAPDATKEELLDCLYETARDVDGSNGAYAGKLGAGLVDAEAFVACVGGDAANPRPTPKPTPTPEKPPFGEEEKGYCVKADGWDQNSGVVKLEGGDFESDAKKAKCLELCAEVEGVTGCETIWDQWNRGCYAHTRDVARGNGVARHSCWIADDDGAEPAPRPTPRPTAKPVGDDDSCRDTASSVDKPWADFKSCEDEKSQGACAANDWVRKHCKDTCGPCDGPPTKTVTIDLPDVTDKRSSIESLTNNWHQWGSETLTFDGAVLSAEIKLNWKDQGWGNKKGAVGVSNGDCKGAKCDALAFYRPAPRSYTKQTIELDVDDLAVDGPGVLVPRYRVGGGGGHQIYIRDATLTVVLSDEPSPTPAPTPRPTAEPLHPATDVKVKMHGKVGDLAIASWTHATTASEVKFHVEYLTNEADAEWTRVDDGRSYVDEADGRYYQVVAPPCAHKGKVRVAYVDAAGAASEVAYSNTFKMKCKK